MAPRWVYEGQLLRIPGGLLCEVVCAAGTSARLVNKLHGVDAWYALDELRLPA